MAVFLLYGPLIPAALAWGVATRPAWTVAGGFAGGLALWTLLEYLMHRFAFHGFAPHYQHHATPGDRKYIVAPLWLSSSGSAVLYAMLAAVTGSWISAAVAGAGVLSGYLFYEALHLRIHSAAMGGPLLRVWRKRHYYHHFADAEACYGVTSPIWDAVLGSLPGGRTTRSESTPKGV